MLYGKGSLQDIDVRLGITISLCGEGGGYHRYHTQVGDEKPGTADKTPSPRDVVLSYFDNLFAHGLYPENGAWHGISRCAMTVTRSKALAMQGPERAVCFSSNPGGLDYGAYLCTSDMEYRNCAREYVLAIRPYVPASGASCYRCHGSMHRKIKVKGRPDHLEYMKHIPGIRCVCQ